MRNFLELMSRTDVQNVEPAKKPQGTDTSCLSLPSKEEVLRLYRTVAQTVTAQRTPHLGATDTLKGCLDS